MELTFTHRQSAHCESGVTANLLTHYGVPCSEALAFGMGDGLFFAYLPFIRLNKLPLTTYRCAVGEIFKRATRRLGVHVVRKKFSSPLAAERALDENLEKGIPTGCQTGAYWLPYFPPAFRFHFNMHNLVVTGREGDDYIISDPVFDETVRCNRSDLLKARFAKGALAPKGAMYHMDHVPGSPDLETAVVQGIRSMHKIMMKNPIPIFGVKGIRFLGKRLEKWPLKLGEENARLHLGQLIRMQEEIGTGGGGFRFIYAAFLQEAARLLNNPGLKTVSEQMTLAGDKWREFAVSAARICKGRPRPQDTYPELAQLLNQCSDMEKEVYRHLIDCV